MKLAIGVALLLVGTSVARADDALYACHEASGSVAVQLKPETSLVDLVAWLHGFTCKNVVFAADVPKRAAKVTIVSSKPMTPKQAIQLFVDAVEAAGMTVDQKPDTFVIKLGAKYPPACPDVAAAEAAPVVPPPPEPAATDVTAAILAGIAKVDETHYTLTGAAMALLYDNPLAARGGVRLVPDGKTEGWKLSLISAGSVFDRLGFRNGDTLVTVAGTSIASADRALEAYQKVRGADRIDVRIVRRGKPLTLTYSIGR